MKIISGTSNRLLAKNIAGHLNTQLIDAEITKFKNGEKRVWIKEDLHGENVVLVQSFSAPVDEYIVEFLLITDALERAGARHVHLVLPWMGYSLQDKLFRSGEPISAKVVANLISNAFVKRTHLLDVHNTSIPGFFSIPTHHHSIMNMFKEYISKNLDVKNAIVVSPDFGGLKRARVLANELNLELANVDKHRDLKTGKVTPMGISGNVEGKVCLIYDDIINTGSTVAEVARFLKKHGAKEVHFFVTHGIFSQNGLTMMNDESINSVVISNSILHKELPEKIVVLDVAKMFSQALKTWM
jgi:ribose-phosphate pyrophosphokinase